MSAASFRFVHASDFHLERLPTGLAEIPDRWRDRLVSAAYDAARGVFDTALAEDAQFLILAGDILDADGTGPRGPLFLTEQFTRLAERNIAVYWAGGRTDPQDAWPAEFELPENVHVFRRGRVDEIVHRRDGVPIARLIGAGYDRRRKVRPIDFEPDVAGLFSIAVIHAPGGVSAESLSGRGIHYWALGGSHNRQTMLGGDERAHYPGTPQGQRFGEPGGHGATVVRTDESLQAQLSETATDGFRWAEVQVDIGDARTREPLENAILEQATQLIDTCEGRDLIVRLTLLGDGEALIAIARQHLDTAILAWLRESFAGDSPGLWCDSIKLQCREMPAQWYAQETIRGDFLRITERLGDDREAPIDLARHLADAVAKNHPAMADLLLADIDGDANERWRLIHDATLLGANLLTGKDLVS